MLEYDPAERARLIVAYREVLREERILAELDPDRLGDDEIPPGFPAEEWKEFVALCERAEAALSELAETEE